IWLCTDIKESDMDFGEMVLIRKYNPYGNIPTGKRIKGKYSDNTIKDIKWYLESRQYKHKTLAKEFDVPISLVNTLSKNLGYNNIVVSDEYLPSKWVEPDYIKPFKKTIYNRISD